MLAWLMACNGPEPEPKVDPCAEGQDPTGVICTLAGTGIRGAGGDGLPARETNLFLPTYAAYDPEGRLVIVDHNNQRLRRLEDDGTLTTIAGTGVHGYAEEGVVPTETQLENPIGIAFAQDGRLFVTELHGARVLLIEDNWLTTYAGSPFNPGYPDYFGDDGPAREAALSQAVGLAIAPDDTLYIADTENNCIRIVSPDGIIDTLAGSLEAGLADGVGLDARFFQPYGLALDGGVLYVSERGNHTVRRIDRTTREVSTVAGTGVPDFSGDGGPGIDAELFGPLGLAVGPDGALYIADTYNHAVRRLDLETGLIETVVGQGGQDGFLDGVPPEETLLNWPHGLVFSPEGDLVLIEHLNDRVRQIKGFLAP